MFFLIRQNISIYFIPLRYFPIHYSKVSIFIFRVFRSFPFERDYLYQYAVSISYHLSHLTCFHLYISNFSIFICRLLQSIFPSTLFISLLYLSNISICLAIGCFHLYLPYVSLSLSFHLPNLKCFHLYLRYVSLSLSFHKSVQSKMFPSLPLECFHLDDDVKLEEAGWTEQKLGSPVLVILGYGCF